MNCNDPLITGEIYHIYSKSIHGYNIFNRTEDYIRILNLAQYYQWKGLPQSFCHFLRSPETKKNGFNQNLALEIQRPRSLKSVQLIGYCIMGTHLHFLLKQLEDDGISNFMQKLVAGYSLYFNLLHNRHGPLWQSRFGRRQMENLGDLITTSHYIHSNPVKDMGKPTPCDWEHSSYHEYCERVPPSNCLCQWQDVMPIHSKDYQASMAQYLIQKGLA